MTHHLQTIVAVTGEDDRYGAVRSRATALAAGGQGTVILYDLDAGGMFASPVPTEWSGEGERELTEREAGPRDRLDPDELDTAGRSPIADQVRQLRSMGVDAWAMAPDDQGRRRPRGLRRAATAPRSCWCHRTSRRLAPPGMTSAPSVSFEVVGEPG